MKIRVDSMTPSDYHKVKEIFHSAVELPPKDRGAFLNERCHGNNELRSEVERLLNSLDDEFLETPAVDPISGPGPGSRSRSGQRIGHYEVIRKIGSGGMGEVYLAVDGKLGRQVAVKILPDDFTADESRLDRFRLEARAASSLSHPNILTIFEVGEWEGTHYIATEYVDGETLRQRLTRDRLSMAEAMDLGIQLALGITAAHEASICHRDIKPENIMIRRDGLLKVVDFGLAKLVASPFRPSMSPVHNDGPTVKIVNTEPGVIMGTVQYMSPEQTRGLATDERSDIWSIGCVLYEMLTGHAPFKGDTSADMVAEIVKSHPELPSRVVSDIPERLDEIISKSLEKHPDERYQTAKDLLIDLKRLKRNLELEDTLERSQPRITTDSGEAVISGPNIISTRKGPKDLTEVNSAQYLYWGMKAHRWTAIGITLFVIGLVAGTAMLVRYYWRQTEVVTQPLVKNPTQERLTSDGKTLYPVISPDGKFLAYVRNDSGRQSLWVKQISTNTNIKVVDEGEFLSFQWGLTFTPDSNYVYFSGTTDKDVIGSIYSVAALGGPRVKLIPNGLSPSFSSDGALLVFSRVNFPPQSVEAKLLVANARGGDVREVVTLPTGKICIHAALSPNGNLISCVVAEGVNRSLWIIGVHDGTIREMLDAGAKVLTSTAWLPDMSAIIANGYRSSDAATKQIWTVPYPEGTPTLLTDNLNSYDGLSLTSDGKSLVSVETESRSSIWVSPNNEIRGVQQVTNSGKVTFPGIAWDSNSNIVYVSNLSGFDEIWRMKPDGSDATQLTNDRLRKGELAVSADGQFIVYEGTDDSIWRINADGSNPVALAQGKGVMFPDISPDSKWVIFSAWTSGKLAIWRVPLEGGNAEQITTDHSMYGARISPDGKQIAALLVKNDSDERFIGILPIEGGNPIKEFSVPLSTDFGISLEWSPDGKGIIYIDGARGYGNIWLQPVDGRRPSRLTEYKSNGILHGSWSNDGKRIVLLRSEAHTDAIMITNFR